MHPFYTARGYAAHGGLAWNSTGRRPAETQNQSEHARRGDRRFAAATSVSARDFKLTQEKATE